MCVGSCSITVVVGDVVGRHEAGERGQVGRFDRLRVLNDGGDLVGDRALVERVGAAERDLAERLGEVEVA